MNTKNKIAMISFLSIVSLVGMTLPAFADDGGGRNSYNYGYGYGGYGGGGYGGYGGGGYGGYGGGGYGGYGGGGYGGYGGGGYGGYGSQTGTLVPPQVQSTVSVTLSAGWNLVDGSVFSALKQNAASVIGDYWNGSAYQPHSNGPVDGIWIYSVSGTSVAITSPTRSNLNLQVQAGSWGMIGNPYPVSQTVTLQAGDVAYTYDPAANQYSAAYTGTLTLQPGQGAWIYSANGGTYSIGYQPPSAPGTVTSSVYSGS